MPGSHQPFTAERKAEFLEHFRASGLHHHAAEAVQVAGSTVHTHYKTDPAFREAYDQAKEYFADSVEKEALRRGMEGWIEKPVVDKDGNVVGQVHKYSDRLLELALKRHRPEYGEKVDVRVSGGVILIPMAASEAQWELEGGAAPVSIPAEVMRPKELKRG